MQRGDSRFFLSAHSRRGGTVEEEEEEEEEDAWCREKDACPVLGESGTLLAATADGSAQRPPPERTRETPGHELWKGPRDSKVCTLLRRGFSLFVFFSPAVRHVVIEHRLRVQWGRRVDLLLGPESPPGWDGRGKLPYARCVLNGVQVVPCALSRKKTFRVPRLHALRVTATDSVAIVSNTIWRVGRRKLTPTQ